MTTLSTIKNKDNDEHVIFIDRLVDDHIQQDKKKNKKANLKENKKDFSDVGEFAPKSPFFVASRPKK